MTQGSVPTRARPIITIVEDDADLLHSLRFSLELEGWAVTTYPTAEALLAAGPLPEWGCLIIDYVLPGACGLDLLSQLRAQGVSMPAIIITTNPGSHVRRGAAVIGASIIEKPLLNESLIDAIRNALASDGRTN